MMIRFQNYSLGPMTAAVAKEHDAAQEMCGRGLNVLCPGEGAVVHLPSGTMWPVTEEGWKDFTNSATGDVFSIDESGRAYRAFVAEAADNALVVTDACNSNCLMCPTAESIRRKAERKQVRSLLELVRHMPVQVPHLTITGGEPFLLGPSFFDLLSALRLHIPDTSFLLLTNGRALAVSGYASSLAECAPHRLLTGIPLHGPNAAVHDRITQVPGSFEQTCGGIWNLLSHGLEVEIRVVVSGLSAPYMMQIAQLISEKFPQTRIVRFVGLEMLGNAAVNTEVVWLPYREAFRRSKEAVLLLLRSGIDVSFYNFPLCSVDPEYWPLCENSISPHKIRYGTVCSDCRERKVCGGLFAGSLRLAERDLMPIGGEPTC